MDILEEYEASNPLSESVLLEDIDEYEIYKHYMGFYPELRTSYSSPLRERDESPSFSMFSNLSGICEYRWKDSGRAIHGDIFKLVKILFNLKSNVEAVKKIRQDITHKDYGLTTGRISLKERPKDKGSTIIKVRSKEFTEEALKWWFRYGITLSTLQLYNATQVEWFSMNDTQIYPKDLCFAYRELDKYQIYQPNNPDYKFRNNYDDKIVMGFHQLKYKQDTLIITKSKKDVMALYQAGFEAVAARSESVVIPSPFLDYFDTKYKRKFELFDNDGKHNGAIYHDPKIYIPIESGCKDFSDFTLKWGLEAGTKLINQLINNV